ATDSGSRTSVMLSRVILVERFRAEPSVVSRPPDVAAMLGEADAALLIGDAALAVDPATLPFETLDLVREWVIMTGLPMVFAVGERLTEPRPSAQRLPTPRLVGKEVHHGRESRRSDTVVAAARDFHVSNRGGQLFARFYHRAGLTHVDGSVIVPMRDVFRDVL